MPTDNLIRCHLLTILSSAAMVAVLFWTAVNPVAVVAQQSSDPTRKDLIETLTTIMGQLENGEIAKTEKLFFLPAEYSPKMLQQLIKRKVISRPGIEALSESGQFGLATFVVRKSDVEEVATEFNVPLNQCYAMKLRQGSTTGEVVAYWDGSKFKILDLNRIGKMVPHGSPQKQEPIVVDKAGSVADTPEAGREATGATDVGSTKTDPIAAETKIAKPAATEAAISEKKSADSVVDTKPVQQDSTAVVPVESSAATVEAPAALPQYETQKRVAIENYSTLASSVAANPNDVSLRARFVHTLLLIGNAPQAWKESVEIYQLAPTNIEVIYAIDQSIAGLKRNGIFQVGVPCETFETLMGKPSNEVIDGEVVRWEYPLWTLDFNQSRFTKLTRVADLADSVPKSVQAAIDSVADEGAVVTAGAEPHAAIDPATALKKTPALPANSAMAEAIEPAKNQDGRVALKLVSYENRLAVISTVRAHQNMPLKDIMKLIQTPPVILFEGLQRSEAEQLMERFSTKGAVTEILTAKQAIKERSRTKFAVEISGFGDNKIAVIKAVRNLRTDLRLMEARKIVENSPSLLMEGLSKEAATSAVAELKAAGADAIVK